MTTLHRFGSFEVDESARLLRIDGRIVPLGSRAFDVLVALILRANRVVTKSELLDAAWPGLVVEEGNVQIQVASLRKVLGTKLIVTIPGRGYQFTAKVDDTAHDVNERLPQTADTASTHRDAFGKPANLPNALPPLYGRNFDVDEISRLLEGHRIVSIVGAPGIGKTRVARAVSHRLCARYDNGVRFIELAMLTQSAQIVAAVAQALGLQVGEEFPTLASIVQAVRGKALLLALDNCEHLSTCVSRLVSTLAREAPTLAILVTSQEPIKCAEENVYRLATLAIPAPGSPQCPKDALEYGAVALFVARVQAADRHFTLDAQNVGATIEVCRRLDGLALAIELAAARVQLLGVEGLLLRLNARFSLLTHGIRTDLPRHQTLHAALEWSYALLSDTEKQVLCRLGVFVGSFSLNAAVQVAGDAGRGEWQVIDDLGRLIDKSLVATDLCEPPRYRLLETIRAYALERLAETGEMRLIASRHARTICACFEAAYASQWHASTVDHLAQHSPELDNLRSAVGWCKVNDHELQIALVGAAAWLWFDVGLNAEGIAACRDACANISTTTDSRLEARLLAETAQVGWFAIPAEEGAMALDRALTLYRAMGDRVGLYVALARRANFFTIAGDDEGAQKSLDECAALEDSKWPPRLRLQAVVARSMVLGFLGPPETFRAVQGERLHLARLCENKVDEMFARVNLVLAQVMLGEFEDAIRTGRELAVKALDVLPKGCMGYLLAYVSMAMALLERVDEAADMLQEAVPMLALGALLWRLLDIFALIALLNGRNEVAAQLFGAGMASFARRGQRQQIGLRRLHDEVLRRLQRALSEEALSRLKSEGEAISEDEAVTIALTQLRSHD